MASDAEKSVPETKEGDYWQESSRPLAALVFILPLLAIYEIGMLFLGKEALRNGADFWLRQFLDLIGFGQYFLLPLLTISLLLGWHHLTGRPWQIAWRSMPLMILEVAILAGLLVGIGKLIGWLIPSAMQAPPLDGSLSQTQAFLTRVVQYLGAGIYEELLFRLILLTILAGLLRLTGLSTWWSYLSAGALSAIIFALAHHLPGGEAMELASRTFWRNLVFRISAGFFFAVLFFYRGFGIAAATHALYDVCTEFDHAG